MRKRSGALVVAFILASMFCIGNLQALNIAQEAPDRVRLKNGAEVKAKVLAMTSETVTYSEAAGQVVTAKKDDVMTGVLGKHLTSHFVEAKRQEWRDYITQVSPWELESYLAKY